MPNFFEGKSDNSFILHIQVKPNSKKQTIVDNEDFLTISICSKPIQNKANKELLNLIKKKLKISSNQIQIISGFKSSNKTIKIKFPIKNNEKDIIQKLID